MADFSLLQTTSASLRDEGVPRPRTARSSAKGPRKNSTKKAQREHKETSSSATNVSGNINNEEPATNIGRASGRSRAATLTADAFKGFGDANKESAAKSGSNAAADDALHGFGDSQKQEAAKRSQGGEGGSSSNASEGDEAMNGFGVDGAGAAQDDDVAGFRFEEDDGSSPSQAVTQAATTSVPAKAQKDHEAEEAAAVLEQERRDQELAMRLAAASTQALSEDTQEQHAAAGSSSGGSHTPKKEETGTLKRRGSTKGNRKSAHFFSASQEDMQALWMWDNMTKAEALTELTDEPEGTFLVRPGSTPESWTISVVKDGAPAHMRIVTEAFGFCINNKDIVHPSLSDLIKAKLEEEIEVKRKDGSKYSSRLLVAPLENSAKRKARVRRRASFSTMSRSQLRASLHKAGIDSSNAANDEDLRDMLLTPSQARTEAEAANLQAIIDAVLPRGRMPEEPKYWVDAAIEQGGDAWPELSSLENKSRTASITKIRPWLAKALKNAYLDPRIKKAERDLLRCRTFTATLGKRNNFKLLKEDLGEHLTRLGEPLRELHDAQNLGEVLSNIDEDGGGVIFNSRFGDDGTAAPVSATTLIPWLKDGQLFDYDDLAKMEEHTAVHVMMLITLGINAKFERSVEEFMAEQGMSVEEQLTKPGPKAHTRVANKCDADYYHKPSPRAGYNADTARVMISVEDAAEVRPLVEAACKFWDGAAKIKNGFTMTPEERAERFHLSTILLTIVFNLGMTFGEFCQDAEVLAAWDEHMKWCPDASVPHERWVRQSRRAREILESDRVAGEPVLWLCELQIVLEAFKAVRTKMHEVYKAWRADTPLAMWADFARTLSADKQDRSKDTTHTTVHNAALSGQRETLARLVEAGAEGGAEGTSKDRHPPLNSAAQNGHTDVVGYLIKQKANVEASKSGRTALCEAATYAHNDTIKVLLDVGKANVDAATATAGTTALMMAAEQGHVLTVEILIEKGAKVDMAGRGNNTGTALYSAAQYGHTEVLKVLLDVGKANIDVANQRGATPLIVASQQGQAAAVEMLLDRGADKTLKTKNGNTAYDKAVKNGGLPADLLEVLKPTAATPEAAAAKHKPPAATLLTTTLKAAAIEGNAIGLNELLTAPGANADQVDGDGWSPLMWASRNGHVKAIEVLLQHGANIDHTNKVGATPLYTAARKGMADAVELLLARGAAKSPKSKVTHKTAYAVAIEQKKLPADLLERLKPPAAVLSATTLEAAAKEGNVSALNQLLAAPGADPDKDDEEGWTALIWASRNGHVKAIETLLGHGANIDRANGKGATPLYTAARKGMADAVELLLARGAARSPKSKITGKTAYVVAQEQQKLPADLLRRLNPKWSPPPKSLTLLEAAKTGKAAAVEKLIKQGASVNAADKRGATPLSLAAQQGHVATMERLLEHGANIDEPDEQGVTPLYISKEHASAMKLLLAHSADVNKARNDGVTPLNSAAFKGNAVAVTLLLDFGADTAIRDRYGDTPYDAAFAQGSLPADLLERLKPTATTLEAAAKEGDVSALNQLLAAPGADPDKDDEEGWTALIWASRNGHVKAIETLLGHGANIDRANGKGATPLYTAARKGMADAVELLLARGAARSPKSKITGKTAYVVAQEQQKLPADLLRRLNPKWSPPPKSLTLLEAAKTGKATAVEKLIKQGASVNAADKRGATPLALAAEQGHVATMECLLEHGANIDEPNEQGVTPLYISKEHASAMKLLLAHGADVNKARNDGVTPLNSAAFKGNAVAVTLLLDFGADTAIRDRYGDTPYDAAVKQGSLPADLLGRLKPVVLAAAASAGSDVPAAVVTEEPKADAAPPPAFVEPEKEAKAKKGAKKSPKKSGKITEQNIGDSCTVEGYACAGFVRFVGTHHETGKARVGVELSEPLAKSGGKFKGHAYFKCAKKHAVLVAPSKVKLATATGTSKSEGPILRKDTNLVPPAADDDLPMNGFEGTNAVAEPLSSSGGGGTNRWQGMDDAAIESDGSDVSL